MTKGWVDGAPVTTDLMTHIVTQRGLSDLSRWLEPKWPDHLHDPFLLPDMDKAVRRLWAAVEKGEKIGIVGDYDMDGTPAAVVLYEFLRQVGVMAKVILPTRTEGYGFSASFIDRFVAAGVSLVVTVDCGIRDNAVVEKAQAAGIDVIITDHHECPDVLPPALAVINPKRVDSTYPFRELCGTGVIYKVVTAMADRTPSQFATAQLKERLMWSLDLVAISTISDMVPLVDENRVLAFYGLKVLQKTKRSGLRELLLALGLNPATLTYQDIAFKLSPKCNASGRMESMDDVFTLLAETQPSVIAPAVERVLVRSTQSQLLLTQMTEEAKQQAEAAEAGRLLIVASDTWHPGLTGIVAARLAEEYKVPVGVLAGAEPDAYRGSFRSIPGVSLPVLLTNAQSAIEKFGGHEQAAGLTILKEKYATFKDILGQTPLPEPTMGGRVTDGVVTPHQLTLDAVEALNQLAPWGIGHPEPLWSLTGVQLSDVKWLKEGQHLKATVRDDSNHAISVIMFGAEKAKPFVDSVLDLYGTVSVNEFRGNKDPQLLLKGLAPHHG